MNILKLITFIFLLSSSFSYSQGSFNDTMYIVPENPIATDSIYLVKYLFFPSVTYFIDYEIENNPDNVIDFKECYWRIDAGAITEFLDTINLGVKEPGIYTLNYKGLVSITNNVCIPVDSSSMNIMFNVNSLNSVINIEPNLVTCFPNPLTSGALTVTSSIEMKSIEILTIEGQQLFRVSELNTNRFEIPILEFSVGTYFLRIIDNQNNHFIKRIVKLE